VRSSAIALAGKCGISEAIPYLVNVLEHRGYGLGEAILALGELRASSAIELLDGLSNDRQDPVRALVAVALGNIGTPSVVEPLAKLSEDRESSIRLHACEALGKVHDKRAHSVLVALRNDSDQSVRKAAKEALRARIE